MIGTVLGALLSHWKRQPFQLFTLILGLSLATALWSGVQAINAEARKSYADAANIIGDGAVPEIVSDNGPISPDTYAKLRRAGWQVSPVIDARIETPDGDVRVTGIDPLSLPPGGALGDAITSVGLDNFLGPDGVFLTDQISAEHLMPTHGDRVAPIDGFSKGLLLMDISAAARQFDRQGFDRLLAAPEQPPNITPLNEIDPDLRLDAPQTAEDLERLTDSFHLNLTAFGFLSFAVGLFIVNGTVGLAFEQRRPVFRTLRALGVTSRTLVALLSIELLIFAVVAGAIGILLGYLIAAALLPGVAATLRGIYGAPIDGALTLSPIWWLLGLGIAVLGTAAASATGLLRVARLAPLAPAKPRAWAMASDMAMRRQLALAALCLATAITAFVFGSGLIAGFVLLGGLLLAAALALPAALTVLIALASRLANGPIAMWFLADTRQQLPGLSLALMALLLALSANIGVGTMVESFRKTFTGWLDQRLVSDIYVSAIDNDQSAALQSFLQGRADGVLPIWTVDGETLGYPVRIYGVADHPIYPANWPLIRAAPDTWTALNSGTGALINEQLAQRTGLKIGDPLDLPNGLTTSVAGVYSDYGNPHGQIAIALPVFTQTYPDADRRDFGVLIDESQKAALTSALINEFGLPPDNLTDQTALKAYSLQVFERTFTITGILNVLTLGVAGFAILTSLLTLAAMRLPQLAPVWALGMTRRDLGRIELIRALILAMLTFVLSIPVGLGLAWVLLSVINLEAFGWRLPMFLFPGDWLRLGILSLAAAALASLWPTWRLARRPPSDLIRVFAAER